MKKKTIIRLSITLIVIAALALWINSRWSAWFHNEAELPYAPQSEPGRVLLTFGDENELSRNISWQYDSIVVPSHVELVDLKSATKLFSVLLASKRPLITELADKLRLKYPLLPTISPCPTMRLEAIRSIIPISCRRYPKSV